MPNISGPRDVAAQTNGRRRALGSPVRFPGMGAYTGVHGSERRDPTPGPAAGRSPDRVRLSYGFRSGGRVACFAASRRSPSSGAGRRASNGQTDVRSARGTV